ncbi:MAG: phospho-N-acetylmuramoyl-pentapeptide-transferase [Oscillospiraceae bacterium]|nr:phospho-N-acetylmuramoyl-pentapeptide-transferase [Oscillospiraceae bacterium]
MAFVVSAVIGKFLIPFLHKLKYGQTILDIGPSWHKKKEGTPTMGGIMFIIAVVVASLLSLAGLAIFDDVYEPTGYSFGKELLCVSMALVMALLYGAVGFLDDYIKVVKKRNLGLTAKQKLGFQFGIAILYVGANALFGYGSKTYIPFVGTVDFGSYSFIYYIISVIVIVGIVNAVNLADGIDGLVGSETFFVAGFYMIIASVMANPASTVLSASVAGGCLGFLVWNFHPAKVFMGDTGSLFLGGMVCALAFSMNMPIILIPMTLVYIIEMLSVVLQVSYFKLTHGKRLFKMSPIHHHFEKCGWSEVKIVVVFSAFTAIIGIIITTLVILGL